MPSNNTTSLVEQTLQHSVVKNQLHKKHKLLLAFTGLAGLAGVAILFFSSTSLVHAEAEAGSAKGNHIIELTADQQQAMGLTKAAIQAVEAFPLIKVNAEAMFALDQQFSVNSPLAGKVIAIHHIHGAVNQGDVLIEIQSPEWIELQAELLSTQIELNAAKQNLKRALALSKSGASSAKNVNLARVEVAKWQSKKSMVQAVLSSAGMTAADVNQLINTQKIDNSNLKLTAQSGGQFYDLKVKKGEIVEAGQTLALLGADQQMVLDAPVPISFAQQLREGQKVSLPEIGKDAVITHIHNVADAQTQTVDVHIRVDSSDVALISGQMMPVQFYLNANAKLFQIPASAISKLDGEMVVYMPANQGVIAQKVKVLATAQGDAFIELMDNPVALPANEVFTSGTAALKAALEAAMSAGEEE